MSRRGRAEAGGAAAASSMRSRIRKRRIDVLLMREAFPVQPTRWETRRSREFKQPTQVGVEIWFYQEGTPFTFGSPSDNVVGFVKAEMVADITQKTAWFTKGDVRKRAPDTSRADPLLKYDNVRVNGHTERRINEVHTKVIRRIFALCAEGLGYTRIAKILNAEGAVTPTPRHDRPAAWSPGTVREILHRPLYRGEVIYNKTRRRDPDGSSTTWADRPESEWMHFDGLTRGFVTEDEYGGAHADRWCLHLPQRGDRGHVPHLADARMPTPRTCSQASPAARNAAEASGSSTVGKTGASRITSADHGLPERVEGPD